MVRVERDALPGTRGTLRLICFGWIVLCHIAPGTVARVAVVEARADAWIEDVQGRDSR